METSKSSFKLSTVFFIRKLTCTTLLLALVQFFNIKIRLIREGLPQAITDAAYSTIPTPSCQCEVTSFERV